VRFLVQNSIFRRGEGSEKRAGFPVYRSGFGQFLLKIHNLNENGLLLSFSSLSLSSSSLLLGFLVYHSVFWLSFFQVFSKIEFFEL
jgi:hypothetical protein